METRKKTKRQQILNLVLLCVLACGAVMPLAVAESISYQGVLEESGSAANNSYDLQFRLYDGPDPNLALQVGNTVTAFNVAVAQGIFSLSLDFGANVFDGTDLWIELAVRPANSGSSYTILAPTQPLLAAASSHFAYEVEANSIGVVHLQSNSVSTAKLQNGSVVGAKLADNAVSSSKLQNNAVSAAKLATDSVTSAKLAANSVTSQAIGSGQVLSAHLASLSVGTDKIAVGAITAAKLANNSVGAQKLTNNSVSSAKIIDGTIVTADLATGSVGSDQLVDGSVQSVDLADMSIGLGKLADNSVSTDKVVNGSLLAMDVNPNSIQVRIGESCPPGSSIRQISNSGSVLCETDDGVDASTVWSLTGNNIGSTDFIGSINDMPLVFKARGQRVARFDDNSDGIYHSPSIIHGSSDNYIAPVWHGATIGGGGGKVGENTCGPGSLLPCVNTVDGHYATVSGGEGNIAQGTSSSIGGGYRNFVSSGFGTVAGGDRNQSQGSAAFIGGGQQNIASGSKSVVVGGFGNEAGGSYSFAAGYRAIVRNATTAGTALGDAGTFVWADNSTTQPFTSSGSNQFLIRASGGVGVGTANPSNQLHVVKSSSGNTTSQHVVQLQNSNTGTQASVLALKINRTSAIGSGNNFITFFQGGINQAVGAIDGNGSGGVTYRSGSADFAEYLDSEEKDLRDGDVVALKKGKLSRDTRAADRVFVVSSAPLLVGNSDMAENRGKALVAFTGQVPVRVNGPVQPGDILLASGANDGTAIAINPGEPKIDYGQVLGLALKPLPNGYVLALVGLPQYSLIKKQAERLDQLEKELTGLKVAIQNLTRQSSGRIKNP